MSDRWSANKKASFVNQVVNILGIEFQSEIENLLNKIHKAATVSQLEEHLDIQTAVHILAVIAAFDSKPEIRHAMLTVATKLIEESKK